MFSTLQFLLGLGICFMLRLLPWRPPNVEPITATLLPFSKKFGWFGGVLFAFLSIVLFDAFTSGIGAWTWITAGTFALIGGLASPLLKGKKGPVSYVLFAVIATLFYDAVTGVGMSALVYGMDWKVALMGQIPFTINHLLGNVVLAAILSPLIEKWVTENHALQRILLSRA